MFISHDEEYYKSRKPRPESSITESTIRFFWDSEKKTILDRTIQEWTRVLIFYTVFFAILGSFFFIQMWFAYDYFILLDKPYMKRIFNRKFK